MMDELEQKEELEKELEQEAVETEPVAESIEEEATVEVQPAEGAEEPAAEAEESETEEPAEEAPAVEETAEPTGISEEKKKPEKEGSNIIGIIVGLAVFIALLAYCWMLPGGGSVQDTGVFYAKDNDLYFYDLKNDPYLVQEGISEGGSYHYYYTAWGASVAEEGHWAYFSDNIDSTGAFDLYRKDTKNAAESELIDSNVYDFMASKNGEVVAYLKGKGEAMELCTYDGTEVRSIADGIRLENEVYALSGDGKYLAFVDAYGMLNAGTVADGSASPLTDAAATYVLAENSGTLYFVAKGTEGYNIYGYAFDGKEPVLVAEKVSSMEMLPNGKDLLYCKASDELVLYSDIIVDDMAESDAALTEADGEVYEKKQQRDAIREAAANGEGFEPLLQECYVLTGGKSVLVADNVVSAVGVEHDRPYIVGYKAKEFTPLRLSVIDGGLDMVEYIYYMSLSYGGMETFLTDTAGNLETLTGYQIQPDSMKLSADGTKAAYLTSDPNTGGNILMKMEMGKAAEAEAVAMDVENFAFVGGDLFYYYDYAEGSGTLAMAGGETTIPGACGVQFADDAVYYIADTDTTGNGQLRCWAGKEETAIDNNVFAFQYKGNGKLAAISGYDVNEGLGDLHYYDGKKVQVLDTDVTAIFIY